MSGVMTFACWSHSVSVVLNDSKNAWLLLQALHLTDREGKKLGRS